MRPARLPVLVIERVNQVVEKYDAFVIAKTGKIGVAMAGSLGAIHDEDALAVKTATREQT